MPIPVRCSCGARSTAPEQLGGKTVKCPKCAAVLSIPLAAGPRPALPAAGITAQPPPRAPQLNGPVRSADPLPEPSELPVPNCPLPSVPLPDEHRQAVEKELKDGERIVWVGRPSKLVVFVRGSWWLLLLFLVLGLLVALLLAAGAGAAGKAPNQQPPEWVRTAAGFIGVLICMLPGFLVLALTPFIRLLRVRSMYYVLTTARAIVCRTRLFGAPTVTCYDADSVSRYRRTDAWLVPGAGDLAFLLVKTVQKGLFHDRTLSTRTYGFVHLRPVAPVEQLLRATIVDPYLILAERASKRLARLNDLD